MKSSEIKIGETYLFISTDNPVRKHLEGKEFTVYEIKRVWRRVKKKRANVKRFFNEFGEGARAEELEYYQESAPVSKDAFDKLVSDVQNVAAGFEAANKAAELLGMAPAFARVDPKEYEVNKDGLPF